MDSFAHKAWVCRWCCIREWMWMSFICSPVYLNLYTSAKSLVGHCFIPDLSSSSFRAEGESAKSMYEMLRLNLPAEWVLPSFFLCSSCACSVFGSVVPQLTSTSPVSLVCCYLVEIVKFREAHRRMLDSMQQQEVLRLSIFCHLTDLTTRRTTRERGGKRDETMRDVRSVAYCIFKCLLFVFFRTEAVRLREQVQVLSGDATRTVPTFISLIVWALNKFCVQVLTDETFRLLCACVLMVCPFQKCAHTLRALRTQFDVLNLLKMTSEETKAEMSVSLLHKYYDWSRNRLNGRWVADDRFGERNRLFWKLLL